MKNLILNIIILPASFMFIEFGYGLLKKEKIYDKHDVLINIMCDILALSIEFVTHSFGIMLLFFFSQYALFHFVMSPVLWLSLIVAKDFCYYIRHTCEHKIRFLWAVHSVHHSSEYLNFSTALRRSIFEPLYRYFFLCPLVLVGFKPFDILLVYLINGTYSFFLHTTLIRKLSFFEWILNTPSYHRVHHGKNKKYIDKNMGQVFIVWDKIFNTFQVEEEPVKYGIVGRVIKKRNIISVVFSEWLHIIKDARDQHSIWEKIRIVFGKPS